MEQPIGVPKETEEALPGEQTATNMAGDDTPPAWQTLGQRLRLAREAAGLTLAEVADRTKVRPGLLSDIEEGAHERLPALTYALGFVKAYARTVGIDPVEAANAYRQESQKLDPVPSMVDLQPLEARRLPSRGLVFAMSFLILLLLGGFWAWSAGWLTPATGQRDDAPAIAEAPEEEAAVAVAPPPAPAEEDSQMVTLTANDEVWLQITDSGTTFFTGTLAPGQQLTLPEDHAWLLHTGRAGALDVAVGARALPPLGRPIETLRNFPLSPDALLARLAPDAATPASASAPAPAPAN